MKKLFVSLVAGLLISGLFLPTTSMATDSTKDQANDAAIGTANLTLFTSSTTRAQTFSPTMNRLTQIDLYLKDRVNGSWVEIALINEPTAEVVVTSGTRMGAGDGWQSVYFGDTVLDTNNVYRIKVYNQSSLNVKWTYNNTNPYPGGFLYSGPNTFDATSDLNFRTYGFNATALGGEITNTPGTTGAEGSNTSGEAPEEASMSIVKPTNLTAEYSDSEKGIKLAWKASTTSDIDGYKVFRSESADKGFAKIKEVSKTTVEYSDQDIAAGKTYYYQVRAYKAATQSYSSNTASAKVPDDIAPAKPKNLSVVDSTEDALTVRWAASTAGNLKNYTINLYRGNEKIRTKELPSAANTYSFIDLDPGILYRVELVATSTSDKASSPAITLGATSFPATIDFIYDSMVSAAMIGVLILLLILSIRTLRHHKKKS